jgi:cold shock CspA family protein
MTYSELFDDDINRILDFLNKTASPSRQGSQPKPVFQGEIVDSTPMKGVIRRWFNDYGFISAEDGEDYFFHLSAISDASSVDGIRPGLEVSFNLARDPSGRFCAAEVQYPINQ